MFLGFEAPILKRDNLSSKFEASRSTMKNMSNLNPVQKRFEPLEIHGVVHRLIVTGQDVVHIVRRRHNELAASSGSSLDSMPIET